MCLITFHASLTYKYFQLCFVFKKWLRTNFSLATSKAFPREFFLKKEFISPSDYNITRKNVKTSNFARPFVDKY